jgi:flagellar assembly protein FliH
MSHWLPKEKLTAYQRWEVAAFDEEQRAAKTSAALAPPVIEAAPAAVAEVAAEEPQESVVLPTAADIERMHSEAQAAGYAAGYGAGYGEGITAAQVSAAAIATLMDQLTQALVAIDQEVADQLLALAVEIAQQVLRQSLRLQPELILPVVREAVTTLHPHHGQPLLFVHPDDALLVRSQLGEQLAHSNWRIIDESDAESRRLSGRTRRERSRCDHRDALAARPRGHRCQRRMAQGPRHEVRMMTADGNANTHLVGLARLPRGLPAGHRPGQLAAAERPPDTHQRPCHGGFGTQTAARQFLPDHAPRRLADRSGSGRLQWRAAVPDADRRCLWPLARGPLDVGVRAINALLTVGRGQRMGLFAGSGVGKSVLLGMMARYTAADVIVVGLIGERGREVKEFIEHILGEEGLRRSVVVAAPADAAR